MSKSINYIRAMEIYNQHIAVARVNGRLFRKTVCDQMMLELGFTQAASATVYNNCKKASAPIEGLGRAAKPKGIRKPGSTKIVVDDILQADSDCYTVMELIEDNVCRCESFLRQGDASECFDTKIDLWPTSTWVLIKGLGPNSSNKFKLEPDEEEIKRYDFAKAISAKLAKAKEIENV